MMQVKNNENYFLRKIGGQDGWELCYKDNLQNSPCVQVIGKLDNNFDIEKLALTLIKNKLNTNN